MPCPDRPGPTCLESTRPSPERPGLARATTASIFCRAAPATRRERVSPVACGPAARPGPARPPPAGWPGPASRAEPTDWMSPGSEGPSCTRVIACHILSCSSFRLWHGSASKPSHLRAADDVTPSTHYITGPGHLDPGHPPSSTTGLWAVTPVLRVTTSHLDPGHAPSTSGPWLDDLRVYSASRVAACGGPIQDHSDANRVAFNAFLAAE
jgi:hypothetical protein